MRTKPDGYSRRLTATERIRRRTASRVALAAAHGTEAVRRRLDRLDRELDLRRGSLLLLAATAALGAGLSRSRGKAWLALSGVSSALLIQDALTGWNPTLSLLRRLGLRTAQEVDQERVTLLDAL